MATWCKSRSSCRGGAVIEILTAAAVFGFSLGFSQEMAKDLRRMLRRHRRPKGSYGPRRPEQPLAADLIRYSRWRSEQIERALRDEPPTPN